MLPALPRPVLAAGSADRAACPVPAPSALLTTATVLPDLLPARDQGRRSRHSGTPPGPPLCALQEVRVPMSVPACVPMRAHVCRASLLCVVCVHMCACVCVCACLCVRVWACVPVCAHLWCVVHPGALRIPETVRCHLMATPGGRAGQLPTPHLGRPQ